MNYRDNLLQLLGVPVWRTEEGLLPKVAAAGFDAVEVHFDKVRRAWEGTLFVLGVADQIPPDGDAGYCPRIAEIVRGW